MIFHIKKFKKRDVDILKSKLIDKCLFGLFCLLISNFAMAQSEESFLPPSEFMQGFNPDSASYATVAKAVYWEHMASIAISNGDQEKAQEAYKESLKLINEAIQLDPRSSYLQSSLAELLINFEDYKNALSAASLAIELDPSNADAYYFSGYIKLRSSQDKVGAMADFKKAADINPDHLKANFYLGYLAFESENYKLASTAYSRMTKLKPYDPEIRYKLALSYSLSGDVNKAIDEYKATIMLNEGNNEARYRLANLYARLGRNQEAINECLILLTRFPNNFDIMLLLAQLYIAVNEYDKATAICDSVLRRNGGKGAVGAEAYYVMGVALKEKDEKKLADENFQKSIELYKSLLADEKNFRLNYDIAKVYDAKGEQSLAEMHLIRYIRNKPDDLYSSDVYNYLGYILVEQGKDLEVAVNYIKKAVDIEPDNGVFRDSLGWAYFKLGKIDEAIAELEKALSLIPDDSDIREHLGEAYLAKGGEYAQKAVAEWEKAIELKPNKYKLKEKLSELYSKINLSSK